MEKIVYPIRINKYLAYKNICARREADDLISQKKVKINGKIAILGDKVNENDKVVVDSNVKRDLIYIAFNKPRGIITHSPQEGEKEINHYSFYAVFKASDEFSVKNESQDIGTIQTAYPLGERFALAGKTWEVIELNLKTKTIFVKEIKGISRINWTSPSSIMMHIKIIQKMREVIGGNTAYKYLSDSAVARLEEIRQLSRNAGLVNNTIVPLSRDSYAVFPWIGTRGVVTLSLALMNIGIKNSILLDDISIGLFVTTDKSKGDLFETLLEMKKTQIDKYSFEIDDKTSIPNKYNEHIPNELLRKQFI
ncbi:MAG: S4 domain-containing protein, partial [Candidatus Staskawiczbacteria bacterium]